MIIMKTCCCGWSFRTGSMIVGYIQLIAFTISLITVIAVSPGFRYKYKYESVEERRNGWVSLYSRQVPYGEKEWPLNDALLLGAFFVGFLMIISIFLIVGTTKGNMWLLLPWITNTMVGVSFSGITWIYELVRYGGGGPLASLYTFIFFFILTTSMPSLWVVGSHFEELRKELMEGGTSGNAPRPKEVEARVLALESMVKTLGRVV